MAAPIPLTLSLNRVLVFAPDLDVAREFYGDALGLKLVSDSARTLTYQGTNFALTVLECESAAIPHRYSETAASTVAFGVRSLEHAAAELADKGVRFLESVPTKGPVGRSLRFTDPFGTVFELMEHVHG